MIRTKFGKFELKYSLPGRTLVKYGMERLRMGMVLFSLQLCGKFGTIHILVTISVLQVILLGGYPSLEVCLSPINIV